MSILPFSHSFGLGNVHVSFLVGGSVIIQRNSINIKKILEDIIRYKATFFAAVPSTLRIIVDNYIDLFRECGNSLKIIVSNTNAMPVEVSRKIIDNLPKTNFCYYYGLTEASRSSFINFNKNPERLYY